MESSILIRILNCLQMLIRPASFRRYGKYVFSQFQKKDALTPRTDQRIDSILTEENIQEETEKRQRELEQKHNQLQKIVDNKVKLPLKLYGTKDTYESKYSYLPNRIMSYYKIHPNMITDYLLKIYKASLYAMIDENESFMQEYFEQGFRQKVIQTIKEAKKNYTLTVTEDRDFLKETPQICQIVDAVCVRGLSMNREQNKTPQQYKKFQQADDVGLITYTPNYLTYDSEQFIDPSKNKTVYQGYEKMVLRVLLRIRTPLRFNVQQIPVSDQVYTWQHLVVMQNDMIAPKHLESKYKLQTLMQWLGKYRFGMWKMVDLDNFMKGNSFFIKYEGQDQFMDPIFEGTVFDRSTHANIRSF